MCLVTFLGFGPGCRKLGGAESTASLYLHSLLLWKKPVGKGSFLERDEYLRSRREKGRLGGLETAVLRADEERLWRPLQSQRRCWSSCWFVLAAAEEE